MPKPAPIMWLAMIASTASLAAALATQLPPDLAQAAAEWDQAQIHGDGAALRRLLADDYTLVTSQGVVENKAQYIAESTAADFKLQPFVLREPVVKYWGDGAVRGGLVVADYSEHGRKYHYVFRFADVWVKRDGRWQIVYTGVTRVSAPARAAAAHATAHKP